MISTSGANRRQKMCSVAHRYDMATLVHQSVALVRIASIKIASKITMVRENNLT